MKNNDHVVLFMTLVIFVMVVVLAVLAAAIFLGHRDDIQSSGRASTVQPNAKEAILE